jgi:hypothetical protein
MGEILGGSGGGCRHFGRLVGGLMHPINSEELPRQERFEGKKLGTGSGGSR